MAECIHDVYWIKSLAISAGYMWFAVRVWTSIPWGDHDRAKAIAACSVSIVFVWCGVSGYASVTFCELFGICGGVLRIVREFSHDVLIFALMALLITDAGAKIGEGCRKVHGDDDNA